MLKDELNPEECDATKDDSSNAAGLIKNIQHSIPHVRDSIIKVLTTDHSPLTRLSHSQSFPKHLSTDTFFRGA